MWHHTLYMECDIESEVSKSFQWNSPTFAMNLCLITFQSSPFLFLCHFLFPKEQEEEMSCWEGAEGGASQSQRHQSESELGHYFLCDDAKLDELPGPKFRSLRHLRQVNLCNFFSLLFYIKLCIINNILCDIMYIFNHIRLTIM